MLSRKVIEMIEERLVDVPRNFAMAFAVRAAMRVLPVIASKAKNREPFWFWEGEEAKHLFSVMHAQRVAVSAATNAIDASAVANIVFEAANAASVAAKAASAAPACASSAAASYAAASSNAVASANYSYTAAVYTFSATFASATDAACDAASIAIEDLKAKLLEELGLIAKKEHRQSKLIFPKDNVFDYLQKPLWLSEPPNSWLEDWFYFKQSVLALDAGFEDFLDWFDARITGEVIDWELLENQAFLPEEILAQDVASINVYLSSLGSADKTLNRVRAIFMGHGTAGKTSLVRCLQDEEVTEGREDMTPGIDIREWPLPDSEIRAHLWDFGGQVIAHATHQFFLRSGCLYVLVMDSRAEINATEQAQYWLEHVKAFAGSAPVILVGNKADKVRINPDVESLKERYPNIVGFYNLSCTQYKAGYKSDFDSFKRDFIKELAQLDLHQVKFLDAHFNAMEALRTQSRQQAFLSEEEFSGFCEQSGVQQQGGLDQAWLLDTLDKLGVIIHFPDLAFHNAYVLNPRWLTYGVYTLLYSKEAKDNLGQLSKKQVVAILQKEKVQDEQRHVLTYPTDKCGFIIEAMRSFKLCYFLKDNSDMLVIPDLLPASRPTIDFDKDQPGIIFEFRFPHLLPRHVMPMFIVFRHDDIEGDQVWQTGVVLKHQTHAARAMVTANYSDRVITLNVQGSGAKEYLHILHDEIIQIARKLKELPYEEWVELPESAIIKSLGESLRSVSREKADYRQLLGTLKANQQIYISTSGVQYDLFKILGGIMTNDTLEKETGGGYVINSENVVINNGHMGNTTLSGDVNITQLSADLNAELRKLIADIEIEVGSGENKNKALRELELVRKQVTQAVDGDQLEKQDAKTGLKEFAEKFKNGLGYVALVTNNISTISEKLPGLIAKVGAFISCL